MFMVYIIISSIAVQSGWQLGFSWLAPPNTLPPGWPINPLPGLPQLQNITCPVSGCLAIISILRNQLVRRGNSNSYYLVSVRTAIWNYIEGWSWEHWAKIISRCLCSVKFGIYVEFRKQFSWLGAILPYYTFDIRRDWKIGSIFFSPVITGAITIFMQIIFMQVLDSQN